MEKLDQLMMALGVVWVTSMAPAPVCAMAAVPALTVPPVGKACANAGADGAERTLAWARKVTPANSHLVRRAMMRGSALRTGHRVAAD